MASNIIHHKCLSYKYWAEAVAMVPHIQILSPTRAKQDKNPFETMGYNNNSMEWLGWWIFFKRVHKELWIPWHSKATNHILYIPTKWGWRKDELRLSWTWQGIHHKGLGYDYWAEIVVVATHIQNLCPTSANWDKTPLDMWCGWKPKAGHTEVFRCLTYIHVEDKLGKKIKPKSILYVFKEKQSILALAKDQKDY